MCSTALSTKSRTNLLYYQVTQDVNLVHQIVNALYQLKVLSVLVEGGAQLLQSFIDEGLWDEIRVITNNEQVVPGGLPAPRMLTGRLQKQETLFSDTLQYFVNPANPGTLSSLFFLIASIILTAWLTIAFKLVERLGINNLQAIVYNYMVCVITGSFVNGSFPVNSSLAQEAWLPWALVMGFGFISLFNLAAYTVQKIGVAAATVAYKLSLVIPFVFSIYLYNEKATALKFAGVALALLAVWFTTRPAGNDKKEKNASWFVWAMPLLLFVGSGLLDTMIKYVEQAFINPGNQDAYLITAFVWQLL